jgi:hypothetical protein
MAKEKTLFCRKCGSAMRVTTKEKKCAYYERESGNKIEKSTIYHYWVCPNWSILDFFVLEHDKYDDAPTSGETQP